MTPHGKQIGQDITPSKLVLGVGEHVIKQDKNIRDQMRFVQESYDVQTKNGRDYEKQKEWEYRIRDILEN